MRRARCSVLALSDILLRSTPSTKMWPLSITSRPERQLSSVVLPQPDGPMIATISPAVDAEVDAAQGLDLHLARVIRLDDIHGFDDRGVWAGPRPPPGRLGSPFVVPSRARGPGLYRCAGGRRGRATGRHGRGKGCGNPLVKRRKSSRATGGREEPARTEGRNDPSSVSRVGLPPVAWAWERTPRWRRARCARTNRG